jgi:hypothetical protein
MMENQTDNAFVLPIHWRHAPYGGLDMLIQENLASRWSKLTFFLVAVAFVVSTTGRHPEALAEQPERELGVYSLSSYENNWKGNVSIGKVFDPYYAFWSVMANPGYVNHCNLQHSKRYMNKEVNVRTVLVLEGDNYKSWDEFDLVFFYGHNNTIPAPHPDDDYNLFEFKIYVNGTWQDYEKNGVKGINQAKVGWGTMDAPFDYWTYRPITYADLWPGAVTYLHNEYTSCVLGYPYDYGGGFIDPYGAYREHWYDTPKGWDNERLGEIDLEWLILHGCQAVITCNENGTKSLDLALRIFRPIHGRYHIVMGHYCSYSTLYLKPLDQFAYDLIVGKSGVPIQTAYFDTDPDGNTSAFAAESDKGPFYWSNSVISQDRWLNPMPDYPETQRFSQRWVVPSGVNQWEWK